MKGKHESWEEARVMKGMKFTGDEKAEFLHNIRRARGFADKPCLVLGDYLNFPLTEKTRAMFLSMLDEAEAALSE